MVLVDPLTGRPVEGKGEGEICFDLSAKPLSLMTGYQGDEQRNAETAERHTQNLEPRERRAEQHHRHDGDDERLQTEDCHSVAGVGCERHGAHREQVPDVAEQPRGEQHRHP